MTAEMFQAWLQAVKADLRECGFGVLFQWADDGFEFIVLQWMHCRLCPTFADVEALARRLAKCAAAHHADY